MKTNNPLEKPIAKFNRKQNVYYIYYMIDPYSGVFKVCIDHGFIRYSVYVNGEYFYTILTGMSVNELPQPMDLCRTVYDIPEHLLFETEKEAAIYLRSLTLVLSNVIHEGIQVPTEEELEERIASISSDNPKEVRLWPSKKDLEDE